MVNASKSVNGHVSAPPRSFPPAGAGSDPYVGPRPFQIEDRFRFFGRDVEAAELLSLIIAHRVVVLYATSGAGKSSLLNANITPGLEQRGFEVFPAARVTGFAPIQLDQVNPFVFFTLLAWAGEKTNPADLASLTIGDYLAQHESFEDQYGRPVPRVLIFDQFEELFTAFPTRWRERSAFFTQITEALAADPSLRVIFSMREDFIAQLEPYAPLFSHRLRHRYRLERLLPDAALRAVIEPLQNTPRSFAPDTAEKLVEDLLQIRQESAQGLETAVGQYVEPVQLQVVCQNLWRSLPADVNTITLADIRIYGDVGEALAQFYENSVRQTAADNRESEGALRNWFEKELITSAKTRGTVFQDREKGYTGSIRNAAVTQLDKLHIIRGEIRAGSRWYELTHDRFIEPILESNEKWFRRRRATFLKIGGGTAAIFFVIFLIAAGYLLTIQQTRSVNEVSRVNLEAEETVGAIEIQLTSTAAATTREANLAATPAAATRAAEQVKATSQAQSLQVLSTAAAQTAAEDPESVDPDVYEAATVAVFDNIDADERLERLAVLFELLPDYGDPYDETAVTLFNGLDAAAQAALFNNLSDPAAQSEQLAQVVPRLILTTETLFVDDNAALLAAMASALEQADAGTELIDTLGWWQTGLEDVAAGEYEAAVVSFTLAIQQNPDNPLLYFERAQALRLLEQYEDALADLQQTTQLEAIPVLVDQVEIVTAEIETAVQAASCNELFFRSLPTDSTRITQLFGANANFYTQFGLPGHQGVDFEAPLGANIYAVAAGTVYLVDTDANTTYGIQVRIQHDVCGQVYRTVYAQLQSSLVEVGQIVRSGQLIAYSGSTGNASGAHLHLELRLDDAPASNWPNGIIDPMPFLEPLLNQTAELGLHAGTEPQIAEADFAAFALARPEVIKVLSYHDAADVFRLAEQHPDAAFIVRTFLDLNGRDISPQGYFEATVADVQRTVDAIGAGRDVVVEIHSEPNLTLEGLGSTWNDGAAFADWWLQVLALYRQEMPEMRFIYPGLSPGASISNLRIDSEAFIAASREAVAAADGLGVHLYWSDSNSMEQAIIMLDDYLVRFPDVPIWITEASNNREAPAAQKAAEYLAFWQELQTRPQVYGVIYFIVSAGDPAFSNEVWVETEIPEIVGSR